MSNLLHYDIVRAERHEHRLAAAHVRTALAVVASARAERARRRATDLALRLQVLRV